MQGITRELAKHCLLQRYQTGKIHLLLDETGDQLRLKSTEEELKLALQHYFNETLCLTITSKKVTQETPVQREERKTKQRQAEAEAIIYQDENIRLLQTELEATIIPGSIKPKI